MKPFTLLLLSLYHASAFVLSPSSPCCIPIKSALDLKAQQNDGSPLGKYSIGTGHWETTIPLSRESFFVSSFLAVLLTSKSAQARSNPRMIESKFQMNMEDGGGNPRTNPRTTGFLLKRFTGDSTPFKFEKRPVRLVREWSEEMPFAKDDFSRADESNDAGFYSVPRFVYHIDEGAVSALTQYYRQNIEPGSSILDICSSWVSHYPLEFKGKMARISGTGMNFFELKANEQLSDFKDKNLNVDPTLPYEDASFDVVTCVVSIDYLIKPIDVLKEVNRVLKPGGKVIIRYVFISTLHMLSVVRTWLRQHAHSFFSRFFVLAASRTAVSRPKQSRCGWR